MPSVPFKVVAIADYTSERKEEDDEVVCLKKGNQYTVIKVSRSSEILANDPRYPRMEGRGSLIGLQLEVKVSLLLIKRLTSI